MVAGTNQRNRITEIRVRGVRTLADVTLRFEHPMTVLIGANAAGKSTLIEACELLRLCTDSSFFDRFTSVHGGAASLLRQGANELALGATIDGPSGRLSYDLVLQRSGGSWLEIAYEEVTLGKATASSKPTTVALRSRSEAELWDRAGKSLGQFDVDTQHLLFDAVSLRDVRSPVPSVKEALSNIEVHVPFDVAPGWVQRSLSRVSQIRDGVMVQPSPRVGRLGGNLANVFLSLQSGPAKEWERTLGLIRLGLGDDVEGVAIEAVAGGGQVSLGLRYRHLSRPVPAFGLSDGTLAYLAMVAVVRSGSGRTLLAFDEPELHFHPHLLARVYDLLDEASEDHPVLIATHSDRVLDELESPDRQAVLCELGEAYQTRLIRPDTATLQAWLADYRGLGDLRREGYERHVMVREVDDE